MPVNSTHPDYDANLVAWQRARDVIAGEDAVKTAGVKYLPRLDSQTDDEYLAYKSRASFFNATSRIADGYVGRIFRRDPTFKLPDSSAGIGRALDTFVADADLLGTPLTAYAKDVTHEVITVGRAGSLVEWEDISEKRAHVVMYETEKIINWHSERVNGHNVLTLVVLKEHGPIKQQTTPNAEQPADAFRPEHVEQIRVLKLVPGANGAGQDASRGLSPHQEWQYQVEIWQHQRGKSKRSKSEWILVETLTPLRLGKSKPLMDWLKGQTAGQMANMATRDLINLVGSVCLAQNFAEQAPDHPTFSVLITSSNISQAAQDALRWMRGGGKSQQAVAVLDALGLLEGDRLAPLKSKHALAILNKLKAKGHGQVVMRSDFGILKWICRLWNIWQ